MAKVFKSAEFVDTDSDIMELTSSSSESDSDESSGSTAVAEQLEVLWARDSIDRELDAMDRPPPEAFVAGVWQVHRGTNLGGDGPALRDTEHLQDSGSSDGQ